MVGSIDINGIIQEAKAQGIVNAGDFVRFLTDYSESTKSNDTAISLSVNTGSVISAVALNKNKVFIAFSFGSPYYLYGAICTINGTTITKEGNTIELTSIQNSGKAISALALSENKVFIAHQGGHVNILNGIVCTISGTTITAGTDTTLLSGTGNVGAVISAIKLDEGKILIAHSRETNYYLYGIVCTISGNVITKGTDTLLVTQNTRSAQGCSAVALSNNRVFISHCHDSNYQLYGIVCKISGTAITKGNDTQLSSVNYSGYYTRSIALNENKVIILHSADNTYSLKAIISTISETSISKGMDTILNSNSNTGKVISAVALSENKIQVMYGDSSNWLYFMLLNVNDTIVSIAAGKNGVLLSATMNAGSTISAVALSENNIFIGHSSGTNNYLYGMVLGYLENLVKTITSSTEQINGIAITDGQAGEMITTVRPDDMMRIKVNSTISTENFGSISWGDVILINRKVLDKENTMYSSTKTLTINGENIDFKFGLYPYSDVYKGWMFGWEFSEELYYTTTAKIKKYTYGEALKNKTFIANWWTGANNTGTQISATASVTILD